MMELLANRWFWSDDSGKSSIDGQSSQSGADGRQAVNPPLNIQIPTDDAFLCPAMRYLNCFGENLSWYLKCCQDFGFANLCNCDPLSALISNIANFVIQTITLGGWDGTDLCRGSNRAADTIEVGLNAGDHASPAAGGEKNGFGDCGGLFDSTLFGQFYNTVIHSMVSPFGSMSFLREVYELMRRAYNPDYIETRKYALPGNARYGGRVAVITYGNHGVGGEMARVLVAMGFKVIIGAKDEVNSQSKQMIALKLDLSSLESVREFAKEVSKLEPKIDLLINSGNEFESQLVLTKDNIEKNLAENYLGHFLLTNLLIGPLKKSDNGRVINVSSIAHYLGSIDYNSMTKIDPTLTGLDTYCQSKLAMVLFTRELSKRTIDTNITAYVVSPEILQRKGPVSSEVLEKILLRISDPMTGIQTLLYVSLDEDLKNESGFYYSNLKKVYPLTISASDDKESVNLWLKSENLVHLEEKYQLTRGVTTHGYRVKEMPQEEQVMEEVARSVTVTETNNDSETSGLTEEDGKDAMKNAKESQDIEDGEENDQALHREASEVEMIEIKTSESLEVGIVEEKMEQKTLDKSEIEETGQKSKLELIEESDQKSDDRSELKDEKKELESEEKLNVDQ